MDRATRPLVIIAAFAASLAVGLLLMMWAMGGLKRLRQQGRFTRSAVCDKARDAHRRVKAVLLFLAEQS